ncbi:MAG TPA: pyruvate kinase [bacterium]|nr:pyruvate kinase [bacterium]
MSKAKIICTLGPASDRSGVLREMMRAGMDVARLNFSHGSHEEHLRRIRKVRELNRRFRRHVKILGDLEGYRIRIGRLKGGRPIAVKKGQIVWLAPEGIAGSCNSIPFDYAGPLDRIARGQLIFIDDGNIALAAEGCDKGRLKARVVVPGAIKERKGINMPGLKIDFTGLTPKDRQDLDFCVAHRVDFIAQSFVRTAADIRALRDYMPDGGLGFGVIAKIENRDGIRNIDSIVRVCDGIMVARGDMGVAIPVYEVPIVQKEIIRKCNCAGKFVITATQMLESMTEHRTPTRAEVTDVANAILDGTDYVMLSAETAAGAYPSECVDMMGRIVGYTEKHRRSVTKIPPARIE